MAHLSAIGLLTIDQKESSCNTYLLHGLSTDKINKIVLLVVDNWVSGGSERPKKTVLNIGGILIDLIIHNFPLKFLKLLLHPTNPTVCRPKSDTYFH